MLPKWQDMTERNCESNWDGDSLVSNARWRGERVTRIRIGWQLGGQSLCGTTWLVHKPLSIQSWRWPTFNTGEEWVQTWGISSAYRYITQYDRAVSTQLMVHATCLSSLKFRGIHCNLAKHLNLPWYHSYIKTTCTNNQNDLPHPKGELWSAVWPHSSEVGPSSCSTPSPAPSGTSSPPSHTPSCLFGPALGTPALGLMTTTLLSVDVCVCDVWMWVYMVYFITSGLLWQLTARGTFISLMWKQLSSSMSSATRAMGGYVPGPVHLIYFFLVGIASVGHFIWLE